MKNDLKDLKTRGADARNEFIKRFTNSQSKETYYDPIKKQPLKLFEKKTTKKKDSIPEDECQSFTDVLTKYDQQKLDLRSIMKYCV